MGAKCLVKSLLASGFVDLVHRFCSMFLEEIL